VVFACQGGGAPDGDRHYAGDAATSLSGLKRVCISPNSRKWIRAAEVALLDGDPDLYAKKGANIFGWTPRGLYRSDPRKWFSPAEVGVPNGNRQPDPAQNGATRCTLLQGAGEAGSRLSIRLTIPAQLAPVTLAFRLKGNASEFRGPENNRPYTVPVGMGVGRPLPLGATLIPTLVVRCHYIEPPLYVRPLTLNLIKWQRLPRFLSVSLLVSGARVGTDRGAPISCLQQWEDCFLLLLCMM
jgi:hypothetical protein